LPGHLKRFDADRLTVDNEIGQFLGDILRLKQTSTAENNFVEYRVREVCNSSDTKENLAF